MIAHLFFLKWIKSLIFIILRGIYCRWVLYIITIIRTSIRKRYFNIFTCIWTIIINYWTEIVLPIVYYLFILIGYKLRINDFDRFYFRYVYYWHFITIFINFTFLNMTTAYLHVGQWIQLIYYSIINMLIKRINYLLNFWTWN